MANRHERRRQKRQATRADAQARRNDRQARQTQRQSTSRRAQRTNRKADRQANRTERFRLRQEGKTTRQDRRAAQREYVADVTGQAPGAGAMDFVTGLSGDAVEFMGNLYGGGLMEGEAGIDLGDVLGGLGGGASGDPALDQANADAAISSKLVPLALGGLAVAGVGLYFATRR